MKKSKKRYYYLNFTTSYINSGWGFSNSMFDAKKVYFKPTPEIIDELETNGIKYYIEK